MVSVDDLVISLRIDETSNLGKLQKQLETLVGPKGDKAVGIGAIDPGFKRDVQDIKDRMVMLTHIAPGARRQPLIEQARAFFTQLRDPIMFQNVLDKMGKTKEWLEDIMVTLGDIGEGTSPIALRKISNFLKDVQIMITQSPDLIGDIKSLATRLEKDIPEYIPQQRLQKIFQKIGHSVRESGMFITKLPTDVRDVLKTGVVNWTEETAKKFKEAGGDIEALVSIITTIKDPIRAFEEAYPGVDLTKLVDITEKFEPYVAATIMAASDKQIAVLKVVYEYIRDQLGQTKVIGRAIGRQQYDYLVQAWDDIRKRFGGGLGLDQLSDSVKEMIDGTEALEYEKVFDADAMRELKERIKRLDHVVLVVSEINKFKDVYLQELQETADLYKHTFEVWQVNMRRMEEQVKLAPTLKKVEERLRTIIAQEEKEKREKREEKVMTAQEADEAERMRQAFANMDEIDPMGIEEAKKDQKTKIEEAEARYRELKRDIQDTKKVVEDTNTEVKKPKPLSEKKDNIEEDPTED